MQNEEARAVEKYLEARKIIESCECGVTVRDASVFLVVPKGADVGDRILATQSTDDLFVFATGLKSGWDLRGQTADE